ncbi:hypothetical protein [Pedobacter heparinus]|uniref:Lipoprotein n=1 Tax=Pedobacter heparinus (strain ATCC 13125 / DSM 2366 / CIP 104194 / JCM 7457 / NBRC 12017 / NCIMB 9290 / NRRL B-14731 / HIM 762-3) TaxID=485917 RepID=C6Y3D1_PEDHD|nr:hypothetical protein [Pedobacter heparinus]ACU05356.1 hypothetical protein Phep_3161 [Pedobacter heparinus DSM 2366]
MKKTILYGNMVLLLLVVAAFTSCSKKKELPIEEEELNFTNIGSVSNLPGFGKSDDMPEGIPFELPKGLRFVSRPDHPFDPDLSKLHGNMNTFYVDVNIERDSSWKESKLLTFPPGLVMLNIAPSRIQNGMLMGRVRINLPPNGRGPGGKKDTITVYLGVACMNSSKGLPWEDNQEPDTRNYVIGKGTHVPYVVTSNAEVLKFLSLLEDKPHLNLTRHQNPLDVYDPDYVEPEWMKPYNTIQTMFWKITDGNGLEEADIRELLKAIENKKR